MAWGGVVAAARLDFVIPLLGLDLYLTERAIAGSIGGGVANVVLAAEFLRNLVEGLAKFLDLVANFNHAAARFLRQFPHLRIAVVAEAATHTVESAVGNEQYVADRIRFLGRFNGIFNLQTAAFILSVGKQDHRLASDFMTEFVVRGEIDGIVERGAAGTGRGARNGTLGTHGASRTADSAGVNSRLVERTPEPAHGVGEILQERNINVE